MAEDSPVAAQDHGTAVKRGRESEGLTGHLRMHNSEFSLRYNREIDEMIQQSQQELEEEGR